MAIKATTQATQREQHITTYKFNMRGIAVHLDEDNTVLSLEMPAILLRAPLIDERAMEDLVQAGFTVRDVEDAGEQLMEKLQALAIGRLLQARRV